MELSKVFRINKFNAISRLGRAPKFAFGLGFVLAALSLAPAGYASSIYVAQNGAGAGNGSDCADALSTGSLNAGDWVAGNTIHLCGTITSTLTAQGSGSSGAPITILFEPGARISAPAIPAGGAIVLTNRSYIIVDGGSTVTCGYVVGSNVTCNNGIIQSTANGTGQPNQVQSIGIMARAANNVEVRNLNIGPLYTHTSTSDTTQSPPGPVCVYYIGGNNISIHNNTLHDAAWCLYGGGSGTTSGFNIYDNEIYNVDHGVGMGLGISNINIYSNHFHDFANWDTTNDSLHHDGIHLFGQTGAPASGANEYDNLFDGDIGYNATAWIYNEGMDQNFKMFNNVAILAPGRWSCCGVIDFYGNGFAGSNNSAYNNTVVGSYVGGSGSCFGVQTQINVTVKNNIFVGCHSLIVVDAASSITAIDNNVYEDIATDLNLGNAANTFVWHSSFLSSFTNWKSGCGCDSHSIFGTLASINLDRSTGRPQSGSSTIGAGANLTNLGIAMLDTDRVGTARPSGTAAWDSGAYEFGAQPRPAPPTNVRVTVQ